MGFRGPIREADSRRALQANNGKPQTLPVPERPLAPRWLKVKQRKLFNQLVDEAVAAGIPTKALDAHAFAITAQYLLDYQAARDSQERSRIGRDLHAYLDVIGATTKARLRMGIKTSKVKDSKTSQLLAMVRTAPPAPTEPSPKC